MIKIYLYLVLDFIILLNKIVFEFVTSVPLLSVACSLVTYVFMVCSFASIFDLSYASTPVTVILFASDAKLIPVPSTIFLFYFLIKLLVNLLLLCRYSKWLVYFRLLEIMR